MTIILPTAVALLLLLLAAFGVHSLWVWRLHVHGKGPTWARHLLAWSCLITTIVVASAVTVPFVVAVIAAWALMGPLAYLWLQAHRKRAP